MTSRRHPAALLFLLVAASAAALVAAPFIGAAATGLSEVWSGRGIEGEIFWRLRVPRVLAAYLAGAALATAGAAFQALFRNPLATPFTLGVASGASLGAALAIRLGLAATFFGFSTLPLAAFVGAVLSVLLVWGLTRLRSVTSTATLLLAGVAVSFFFSSLNLFAQYLSDFTHTFRIIRWLMGGLQVTGYGSVLDMAPFALGGLVILLSLGRELDLLATGEEMAASRGVEVKATRNLIFFSASLMVGGVVAVCGPIGFVGLMIPHICRLLGGPGHLLLTPASALFGGVFLVACDTLARTVIAPAEIPVGVITALLGGPFFLFLLVRGERP